MLLDFASSASIHVPPKLKRLCPWIPPPAGSVKFNVHGYALGKPGSSCIGRVLKDSNRDIIGSFSKYAGFLDSNIAKLLALCEALILIHSSSWITIIDSDARTAVAWSINTFKVVLDLAINAGKWPFWGILWSLGSSCNLSCFRAACSLAICFNFSLWF